MRALTIPSRLHLRWVVRLSFALALCLVVCGARALALPLDKIKLPPGFKISLYTANVPNARQMCRSPNGTLFIGTRVANGKVYAVPDRDKDGKADEVITIISGLAMPNGVAFRKGSLYVAQVHRVLRYDNIEKDLMHTPQPVVVNEALPTDEHHGWKYIKFGPDDLLYLPVGAPCNVCERDENRFACLMRMKPDGSGLETIAHGIRNTVGFAWHPKTKQMYFTDNGRDWLGDFLPPDELNCFTKVGQHFGFPYRYGNNQTDPEFGSRHQGVEFTPPVQCLDPHVAALGMIFYTGKQFPQEYQNQIFIAEHGSWNRTSPLGYRITNVKLDNSGKSNGYSVFAEGWLQGSNAWGRPVDVLNMPDGSILVSDDVAGVIYRIAYEGDSPSKSAN